MRTELSFSTSTCTDYASRDSPIEHARFWKIAKACHCEEAEELMTSGQPLLTNLIWHSTGGWYTNDRNFSE